MAPAASMQPSTMSAVLWPVAIVSGANLGFDVSSLAGLIAISVTIVGGTVASAPARRPRGRPTTTYTATPASVAQVAPRENV